MRVILVPLSGSEHDHAALDAAHAIARRLAGPHLEIVFMRPDPMEVFPVVGDGITPETMASITDETAIEVDRRRALAKQLFDGVLSAGVTLAEYPTGTDAITARFRQAVGPADELVVEHGRVADLIVLSGIQDKSEPDREVMFEAALLRGARPIVVVPDAPSPNLGRTIAIAWNGSPEGVRAVAGALPLLKAADAVHVLTAVTPKTQAEQCQRLADYLAWHGIASERHLLHPVGKEAGVALLEHARELGADLLVMGGYGRSRVREMIFGGVTLHVTSTLDIPVLMAH